jgi:hypothetical protein
MRRGILKPLLALAGLALAAPALYLVSWKCCDHGASLSDQAVGRSIVSVRVGSQRVW